MVRLKYYREAISDYSKAIEINPKDDESYCLCGTIKFNIGDLKGACEDWKKAAELGDEDATKLLEEHCK